MDWSTSDSYHLNLKLVPALPFLHIIQDGEKEMFVSDYCLKNLLRQAILNYSMEGHTYLQHHETFSPHIICYALVLQESQKCL